MKEQETTAIKTTDSCRKKLKLAKALLISDSGVMRYSEITEQLLDDFFKSKGLDEISVIEKLKYII